MPQHQHREPGLAVHTCDPSMRGRAKSLLGAHCVASLMESGSFQGSWGPITDNEMERGRGGHQMFLCPAHMGMGVRT